MAIKFKAQRRKFAELLVEGKITPEVYERWNREAGRKELPERVAKKSKAKTRAGNDHENACTPPHCARRLREHARRARPRRFFRYAHDRARRAARERGERV